MGWSQLIAAVLGMLGGGMLGGRSGDAPAQTADQKEMQTQILDLLRSQKNDYLFNEPLRRHITNTADWLLPKKDRLGALPPLVVDTPRNEPRTPYVPNDPAPTPPPIPEPDPDPAGGGRFGPTGMGGSMMAPPTSVNPDTMKNVAAYLAKFGGRS